MLPSEETDSIGQGKSRGHPRGSSVVCFSENFHWGAEAFNSESLIFFFFLNNNQFLNVKYLSVNEGREALNDSTL